MQRRWGVPDALATAVLLGVFALFASRSWLGWGHLDYDYGREMLVPERLAAGEVIYRDLRYFYGPLSPWLHALGYRVFGPSLGVLYASGLASSALLLLALYAVGRRLGSRTAGLLAALLVCADLMFIPGHTNSFSYVFPYAFPALHGLLAATIALAAALGAVAGGGVVRCVVAGLAAGIAVVTKQDWGAVGLLLAGATALALVLQDGVAARRRVTALLVACAAPPLAAMAVLAAAMPAAQVFTRGLFDPAYFGWRLSWLIMGFRPEATLAQMARTLAVQHARAALAWGAVVGVVVVLAASFARREERARATALRVVAVVACVLALAALAGVLAAIAAALAPTPSGLLRILPPLEGRYAALPLLLGAWLVVETVAIARAAWRGEAADVARLQRWIALAVALVPLARVPAALEPRDYANFALPLALVVSVVLLVDLLPRGLAALGGAERAARLGAVAILALTIATLGRARWEVWSLRTDELVTPRGTMRFFPLDPSVAAYRAALAHVLARTAPGDTLLAIPAEASLSFLSGRGNRLYESGLIAVVADAAADRAFVDDLAKHPPELILVSNRPQPEYGRKAIGVDHAHATWAWILAGYDVEASFGDAFRIVAWRRRAASGPESGATAAGAPPKHPTAGAGALPGAPASGGAAGLPLGIEVERDLPYAEVDGVPLVLDLYRPSGARGPLPVLLFLHGGGWMLGDRRDALPHAGRPAQAFQRGRRWPSMLPFLQSGAAVVSPRYRLSGEAPAPAALEDAQRALAWIARDGPARGLDPSRIVAIGPSAGGHLALLLGLAPLPPGAPRPSGVVDLYGPTDVEDLLPPSRNARPFARRWIPEGPAERALARRMSPLAHVRLDAPPVLIVHGDADDVVPYAHAERLADALRKAGARVELVTLPGGRHGFLTGGELALLELRVGEFLASLGFPEPDPIRGATKARETIRAKIRD